MTSGNDPKLLRKQIRNRFAFGAIAAVVVAGAIVGILLSNSFTPVPDAGTTPDTDTELDTAPPYLEDRVPAPGSTRIAFDTPVILHIKDDGAGVDKSGISLTVQRQTVTPMITGNINDYEVVYKPPANFVRGQQINVTVSAADLAPVPNKMVEHYSFTIAENKTPTLNPIGDKKVTKGDNLEFTVSASDADGDYLRYSAANLPAGATFNPSTRVFSWTPQEVGSYRSITFEVSDGEAAASKVINIQVVPAQPVVPPGMVRLSLVYYGKHYETIDSRILAVRPQYIIANPPHGLWGEVYGYGTWWLLQNVAKYQEAGIKVIGYITSGYEGKGSGSGIDRYWYTLELNKKLIKNMAEIEHVDGVFIDECSAYPDSSSRKYLKELTDLAHSYGLITWGNVGQDDFDPWYFTEGSFDFMKSSEQWEGQSLSPVQEDWGQRISVTSFRKEYTAEDAFRLTLDAWEKGIAYCYISNSEYDSLSQWFEDYVKLLRSYQQS